MVRVLVLLPDLYNYIAEIWYLLKTITGEKAAFEAYSKTCEKGFLQILSTLDIGVRNRFPPISGDPVFAAIHLL